MLDYMEKMLENTPFETLGDILYSTRIMEEEDYADMLVWSDGKNYATNLEY